MTEPRKQGERGAGKNTPPKPEKSERKKGQRGPDKGKRNYNTHRTPKLDEDRLRTRWVTSTDIEEEYLEAKYGSRTHAFRSLLPSKNIMIKFLEKYKAENKK